MLYCCELFIRKFASVKTKNEMQFSSAILFTVTSQLNYGLLNQSANFDEQHNLTSSTTGFNSHGEMPLRLFSRLCCDETAGAILELKSGS